MNPNTKERFSLSKHEFDGYSYVCDKIYHGKRGTTIYLSCKEKKKGCGGRGRLKYNKFRQTKRHDHPADNHAEEMRIFKKTLKQNVQSDFRNVKDIYDDVSKEYESVSSLVSFQSVKTSMVRWRRNLRPVCPVSLRDFAKTLKSEDWKHLMKYNKKYSLNIKTVRSEDRSKTHLLIFDRNFIRTLCKTGSTEEIFADATFKTASILLENKNKNTTVNKSRQLFTLMARKFNHGIPFAWVIMERRKYTDYKPILEYIFNKLAPSLRPQTVMTDFEFALQKAFLTVLPSADVKGCYFHYSQALCKNIRRFVGKKIAKSKESGEIFTKLMALALLPERDVVAAFNKIKSDTSDYMRRRFQYYFQYYDRFWINRVTPTRFSMYRKLKRTNNLIERYHRTLNHKFTDNQDPWMFIKKLGELQATTRRDLAILKAGKPLTRLRYDWIIKNHALINAWDRLDDGLPIEDFLTLTSALLSKNYKKIAHNLNDQSI